MLCRRAMLLLAAALGSAVAVPTLNATANTSRVDRMSRQFIIEEYEEAVAEIIRYTIEDNAGLAYDKLSLFCDRWGHRLQGSEVMEAAIDDHVTVLEAEGYTVSKEPCTTCPHWERGEEYVATDYPKKSATPLTYEHKPSFLCSLGACGRSALSHRSNCLTEH
jgi:hypothetical protein